MGYRLWAIGRVTLSCFALPEARSRAESLAPEARSLIIYNAADNMLEGPTDQRVADGAAVVVTPKSRP